MITGRPGVGKTTLLRALLARWPGRAGGFYTEEVRPGGRRIGFDIVTLHGERGVLARINRPGLPQVSKYGVDVAALEAVGLVALEEALAQADLVVVDEIGKMELLSPRFREILEAIVKVHKPLLGTILEASHPWADALKRHPQVALMRLTEENRAWVRQEVEAWLQQVAARVGQR